MGKFKKLSLEEIKKFSDGYPFDILPKFISYDILSNGEEYILITSEISPNSLYKNGSMMANYDSTPEQYPKYGEGFRFIGDTSFIVKNINGNFIVDNLDNLQLPFKNGFMDYISSLKVNYLFDYIIFDAFILSNMDNFDSKLSIIFK